MLFVRNRTFKLSRIRTYLNSQDVGSTVGNCGTAVEDVDGSTLAVLVAVAAGAALVAELHLAGARTPTVRRQVNEDWMRRYRGWVYGVGFGFQLGLGVVTVVSTPAVYLGFFLAFLSGSVWLGAAAGAAFGLGRSLVLLTAAGVREPGQLHGLHRRMERWRRPSRDILVAAEGAVALAAVLALR